MNNEDPTSPADHVLPDSSRHVSCPYCGETIEILLDSGSGAMQEYVEDCEVCCRPWQVQVRYSADGGAEVRIDVLD